MIPPSSAGSSGPVRSPFPPHGGEAADGPVVPAPPSTEGPYTDVADTASIDGRIAGVALIGLLLPGMLVPTAANADPGSISHAIVVDTSSTTSPAGTSGDTSRPSQALPGFVRTDDGSPVAVRLPADPTTHYAKTTPLVDAMLDADLPAPQRDALRRDLGVLPAPLLRKVVEDGTRLWVVPQGVSEVPALVFRFGLVNPAPPATPDMARPDGIVDYQGRHFTTRATEEIKDINQRLGKHEFDGLYVPSQHLILIREETLPDPAPLQGRHRVALHEIAHAVDDILSRDMNQGPQRRDALKQLYADATARGDEVFVTSYARTNESEHYADSFEAYFTIDSPDELSKQIAHIEGRSEPSIPLHDGHHDALLARDPNMHGIIARDVGAPPTKPISPS